jgi:hypothetical protein
MPFSPPDRKLVMMESFSDVVNLERIAAFLEIHSLSQVPFSKPFELFLFSGSHCDTNFVRSDGTTQLKFTLSAAILNKGSVSSLAN